MPIARETRREAELLDRCAESMGHEYRRRVLFSLYRTDDAGLVIPEDVMDAGLDRDRFVVELVHRHVPKLEEAGFVSWDRESGVVERGDEFGELEPLLAVLSEHYDHIVPSSDPSKQV